MLRFSFLDFFKLNSIRKLKSLLNKFDYDYNVIRWFLDNHYLDSSDFSYRIVSNPNRNPSNDCSEKVSVCLNRFAREEEFKNSDDLFEYSIHTCKIIFVTNFLLLFIELCILYSGVYTNYRLLCFVAFLAFPIVSFIIVSDFYPILSLFRLSLSKSLRVGFYYYASVHFNTLVLILMSVFSMFFLA